VAESLAELDRVVPLQGLLGYLNLSEGRPDARFQKQLSEAYGFLASRGLAEPWRALRDGLLAKLDALRQAEAGGFQDVSQAAAVLGLVFDKVLPAYRGHHADLLFHLSDRDLFQPFFLARVFEAVLAQGGPWIEDERLVTSALRRLNDFVGHRPVAILETRPRGEPYEHERVRPIPLYLRGAGVAWGRYHDLVAQAITILAGTDPAILAEAQFELDLLDELALDPRAYDHSHPANRRPNYVFGEWDPHHLDHQGRYCRYVVRQITLDALMERVDEAGQEAATSADRSEALFEGAAVLAGTLLMATGLSGNSPTAHDSTTSLATLMPKIARYRDAFYARLLEKLPGPHGVRLREERERTKQPFGAVRQHLNLYLARQRAIQLQQRHLALLFAEMGFPEASREEAARIPAASVRLLGEIWIRLTTGQSLAERGDLTRAAQLLPEVEDFLRRGIACGALADPWNILGFQGLFPLSPAQEDSIRDTRIDELVHVVEHLLDLYARLASEAGSVGDRVLMTKLLSEMQRFAAWWDRFASVEVSDVRRVHGGEALTWARHVATTLARWHERGEAAADLAFWRQHLEGFQSAKAFALVVHALLLKEDYRAAMALLMAWLSQAEVPLEDGDYSFHALALRWMLGVSRPAAGDAAAAPPDGWAVVKKFFDYLEANAEEHLRLPELELPSGPKETAEEDDLFGAAYEDVTFRDSAADEHEGSVAEGPRRHGEFALEWQGEALARHLRFVSTVARLWLIAARSSFRAAGDAEQLETLRAWLREAEKYQSLVLPLMDLVHDHAIPEPSGTEDSLVEYDRRRLLKEQVLARAIGTAHDLFLALGAVQATCAEAPSLAEPASHTHAVPTARDPARKEASPAPPWQPLAIRLEQALLRGERDEARRVLPGFLKLIRQEPLLFTALADGGHPRQILRARIAQSILWGLAANLPRLGLLRETFQVLKTAYAMEEAHPSEGRKVTEFDRLFQLALQALSEKLIASPQAWTGNDRPAPMALFGQPDDAADHAVVETLRKVTDPFLELWLQHSRTLRISVLETFRGEELWNGLRAFIRRYGGDLFHTRFLTLGNLRGILHRGVGPYLDALRAEPDPLHPVRLLDELDQEIPRADAVRYLEFILQAVVENYEEYKDYNTTSPQSDYGENLHVLLDFLQLKATHERHAWQFRPLFLVHEILCRRGRAGAAALWQKSFELHRLLAATKLHEQQTQLEGAHGLRLRTVADRLEERFEKPLQVDSLCALIGPAMAEAQRGEPGPATGAFRRQLRPLAEAPTGVGLDIPRWLRRLEQEVQRVRMERTALASLAEQSFRVPEVPLSADELLRQLEDWNLPLVDD
jgi:hypothetical protein